jgi:outer membrane autotransporter protein
MGAEVSMAALSAGNDFVGAATEGLAMTANVGADGVSSFANMGGGSIRQETGSHVDAHTWNAIIALGHQNKKERGTMEYGAFFEYGTGNYTTYNDESRRGDGNMHYTGGGVLAKWTAAHGLYVEGSFRAGTVHDDARNVLSDGVNTYSYETDANYFGAHLGVGKVIELTNGNEVDVYGKYFVNRRNGVSFNAGGDHYDLDAVTSQVLRVGARYTMKRDKWNFYAGAAYEHEFDGKAAGTANGFAIKGADIAGGSFRAELGATMQPDENSPWSIDLNVAGFAGKKQGFSGGVSVAWMF